MREGVAKGAHGGPGLVAGLRMLARSALFMKLTVCVMISGIVMEGMYNLLGQYFQLKLEYTVQDQVGRGRPPHPSWVHGVHGAAWCCLSSSQPRSSISLLTCLGFSSYWVCTFGYTSTRHVAGGCRVLCHAHARACSQIRVTLLHQSPQGKLLRRQPVEC